MKTLPIQQELRSLGLEAVVQKYSLKAKQHKTEPALWLFKYDQIDSPVGDPTVQDCRALILDQSADWAAVAFPYRRFFNAGEIHADPIDWSTAKVFEKEDGSLMTLYWYAGRWHVSTSGVPDGSAPIQRVYERGGPPTVLQTFADRFWELLGGKLPAETHMCFMFELCTQDNRIVVEHAQPRLVLHGCRDMTTLEEHEPETYAARYGWELCRSHPLTTLSEALAWAETLQPNASEGCVVRSAKVDGVFPRVKIKAPKYVLLHHVANGNSPKRLLELVRRNESAEWLAYFENLRGEHDAIKARYEALISEVETFYAPIKDLPSQKDFAGHATKTRFSGLLFNLRKGVSVRTSLAKLSIDSVCFLLGIDAKEQDADSSATV